MTQRGAVPHLALHSSHLASKVQSAEPVINMNEAVSGEAHLYHIDMEYVKKVINRKAGMTYLSLNNFT